MGKLTEGTKSSREFRGITRLVKKHSTITDKVNGQTDKRRDSTIITHSGADKTYLPTIKVKQTIKEVWDKWNNETKEGQNTLQIKEKLKQRKSKTQTFTELTELPKPETLTERQQSATHSNAWLIFKHALLSSYISSQKILSEIRGAPDIFYSQKSPGISVIAAGKGAYKDLLIQSNVSYQVEKQISIRLHTKHLPKFQHLSFGDTVFLVSRRKFAVQPLFMKWIGCCLTHSLFLRCWWQLLLPT